MKFIPRKYALLALALLKISIGGTIVLASLLWAIYSLSSALGWHQLTGIVFTALFVIFAFVAIAHFVSFDVLVSLKKTNDKLKDQGLRANQLHDRWLHDVADDLAFNVTGALLGVFCFTISCLAWIAFDPTLVSRRATQQEQVCLIANHTVRGHLSEYCAGLNKKAPVLQFTDSNRFFNGYLSEYYFYITVFAFGAIFRVYHTYSLVNKFPTYKSEIRRLARYFDEPA
jgi:hypothetical protein